jgi:hypothetical protein
MYLDIAYIYVHRKAMYVENPKQLIILDGGVEECISTPNSLEYQSR